MRHLYFVAFALLASAPAARADYDSLFTLPADPQKVVVPGAHVFTASPYCAACSSQVTNPDSGFANVARAVNARPDGDSCEYSEAALSRFELKVGKGVYQDSYPSRWRCIMLLRNIERDSVGGCLPNAGKVLDRTSFPLPRTIVGTNAFVGLIQFPYSYVLANDDDGRPAVTVRVAFKGALNQDAETRRTMQAKMTEAAAVWEKNSPAPGVHFHFLAVDENDAPNFVVNLVPGATRGPYLVEWSRAWSANTVAHEIGHMMGLDDEYNQVRATLGAGKPGVDQDECRQESLMCRSESGKPDRYHYYTILRRYYCQAQKPYFPSF